MLILMQDSIRTDNVRYSGELNERLEQLGYSTHFEMTLSNKENDFDFNTDFIEKDVHSDNGGQYVFDIKA